MTRNQNHKVLKEKKYLKKYFYVIFISNVVLLEIVRPKNAGVE